MTSQYITTRDNKATIDNTIVSVVAMNLLGSYNTISLIKTTAQNIDKNAQHKQTKYLIETLTNSIFIQINHIINRIRKIKTLWKGVTK